MPKRGRNIYKRKDGRWEARYIKSYDETGKIRYGYLYAKTYNEAKYRQENIKLKYCVKSNEQDDYTVKFCNIACKWLDMEKINVKESTFSRYERIVNKYLNPYFENEYCECINNKKVDDYVIYLSEYGRLDGKGGLSSKSISDIIIILNSILKYAIKNNVSIPYSCEGIRIRKSKNSIKVLDKKEQQILTDFLMNDINYTKLGIILSLYTGMRIGELCALKWENINLKENYVEIRKTLQRIEDFSGENRKTKIIIDEPKSECSKRFIPLPDFLSELLFKLKGNGDEFVLTGDREKYIEPRNMQIRFHNILSECGLQEINFHALRHTFATRCVELGFEIKSLSEILGHSNVKITLDKYVHSSFDLKKDNMKKLDKLKL